MAHHLERTWQAFSHPFRDVIEMLGWKRQDNGTGRFSTISVDTPAIVLRQYMSTMPYNPPALAREVEALHGTLVGHLEITNTLEFDESLPFSTIFQGSDAEESAKQRKRTVGLYSGRSLVMGPPGVSGDRLQLSSAQGRKAVSIDHYIKRVVREDPLFVVSPADEVDMAAGKNRKTRSLERTMLFANQMAKKEYRDILKEKFLFKVVVPSSKPGALEMQLLLANSDEADVFQGVCAGGVNLQESDADFMNYLEQLRTTTRAHGTALLVQGSNTLSRLLLSLEAGADLVGSDLPARLMHEGQALVFGEILQITDHLQETWLREANGDAPPLKLHKGPSGRVSAPTYSTTTGQRAVVNLWNEEFLRDRSSLVAGCQCHACKYHTKAYIHHLLKSKEILADVLLYLHNQHQVLLLFQCARHYLSISKETFLMWLGKLREHNLEGEPKPKLAKEGNTTL